MHVWVTPVVGVAQQRCTHFTQQTDRQTDRQKERLRPRFCCGAWSCESEVCRRIITWLAVVGSVQVGSKVLGARPATVEWDDRHVTVLSTTTDGVQRVGDVRSTADMSVALSNTSTDTHPPIARFTDHDHVTTGARGVEWLPFTVVTLMCVYRCVTANHHTQTAMSTSYKARTAYLLYYRLLDFLFGIFDLFLDMTPVCIFGVPLDSCGMC